MYKFRRNWLGKLVLQEKVAIHQQDTRNGNVNCPGITIYKWRDAKEPKLLTHYNIAMQALEDIRYSGYTSEVCQDRAQIALKMIHNDGGI